MQIKTFRALDMREALRAVKEELGPDAVILSTREVKSGGGAFGLFSRAVVEVTAAVDRGRARPGAPRADGWNEGARAPGARGRGDGRDEMGSGNQYRNDVHEERGAILSHGRLVRGGENLQDSRRQEHARSNTPFSEQLQDAGGLQAIREDLAMVKQQLSDLRRPAGQPSREREGWKAFEEDLRGVRRLVGTLVKNERDCFIERLTTPLKSAYDWLLDSGLETNVVFTLVKELHESLPLDDEQLAAMLRTSVLDLMIREVKISGPLLDEEGGPKAVMIVGPSGVGKTTTIAKLAAFYALRQKRNVALITLDTYRVAAVEQLRVYGSILGLSVDVALTCEDLAGMLRVRKSADLILIDTAGRSPLDETALRELKQFAAPNREVEVHLLLSAGTREADLAVLLSRFMTLPVNSLIFSKLDETTQYGSVFNVLHQTGLPLSYLTTGQRVPEDLEVATSSLLADLLLDGPTAIKRRQQAGNALTSPAAIAAAQVPAIPAAKKGNLLALGWALTKRSEKKSGE
jgi:flagellar biosynthesis protein FlhF